MPNAALNGRLRDLALNEVLQLLAFGRKSGTLRLEAPVVGRRARVEFVQGSIADARLWTVDEAEPRGDRTVADIQAIQRVLFEMLRWRDGQFRFDAAPTPDTPAPAVAGTPSLSAEGTGLRLAVDPILVEATRRAERWDRIADRVPHTEVIPTFVASTTTSLPLLRLSPSPLRSRRGVDLDFPLLAGCLALLGLGADLLQLRREGLTNLIIGGRQGGRTQHGSGHVKRSNRALHLSRSRNSKPGTDTQRNGGEKAGDGLH